MLERHTLFAMRLVILSLCLGISACSQLSSIKQESTPKTIEPVKNIVIASAVPVLASMIDELTNQTAFELKYLPPERYSIKRVAGWLKRQDQHHYPYADVVIGMPSTWPDIHLYPYLREKNIAVIPVDAAYSLRPGGERVVLNTNHLNTNLNNNLNTNNLNNTIETPNYFWLNPANALIMIGICYRDLLAITEQSDLSDGEKQRTTERLAQNFQAINQSLRSVQTELDHALSAMDVFQASPEKTVLNPLAQATLLPVEAFKTLDNDLPTLLISNRKPGHKSLRQLAEQISIWHIDDFSKLRDASFSARWKANIDALKNISIRAHHEVF